MENFLLPERSEHYCHNCHSSKASLLLSAVIFLIPYQRPKTHNISSKDYYVLTMNHNNNKTHNAVSAGRCQGSNRAETNSLAATSDSLVDIMARGFQRSPPSFPRLPTLPMASERVGQQGLYDILSEAIEVVNDQSPTLTSRRKRRRLNKSHQDQESARQ